MVLATVALLMIIVASCYYLAIKYWSVKYEYFLKNEYNKEIVKPFYDNKELENQANKQLT